MPAALNAEREPATGGTGGTPSPHEAQVEFAQMMTRRLHRTIASLWSDDRWWAISKAANAGGLAVSRTVLQSASDPDNATLLGLEVYEAVLKGLDVTASQRRGVLNRYQNALQAWRVASPAATRSRLAKALYLDNLIVRATLTGTANVDQASSGTDPAAVAVGASGRASHKSSPRDEAEFIASLDRLRTTAAVSPRRLRTLLLDAGVARVPAASTLTTWFASDTIPKKLGEQLLTAIVRVLLEQVHPAGAVPAKVDSYVDLHRKLIDRRHADAAGAGKTAQAIAKIDKLAAGLARSTPEQVYLRRQLYEIRELLSAP
jgi:hypothetical protein